MALKFIDAFCGAGGSSLGAELAGLRPVAAINHWPVAARTYEWNHGVRPLCQRVGDVPPTALPQADVVLASPECTNHSLAKGAAPRDETSRNTAFDAVLLAERLRPEILVVENVSQFRKWHRFREWYQALEELGYHLNRDAAGPGQILNAADFGTPQARERLFVVGLRRPGFAVRPPTDRPRRTVRECINWNHPMRPWRELCERTQERIRHSQSLYGTEPHLILFYGSGPQSQGLDRPCRTVVTRDRFALVHGDYLRMLQPDELQRIMGFPPIYRMAGSRRDQVMMLGNAVAPQVMEEILRQALAYLSIPVNQERAA